MLIINHSSHRKIFFDCSKGEINAYKQEKFPRLQSPPPRSLSLLLRSNSQRTYLKFTEKCNARIYAPTFQLSLGVSPLIIRTQSSIKLMKSVEYHTSPFSSIKHIFLRTLCVLSRFELLAISQELTQRRVHIFQTFQGSSATCIPAFEEGREWRSSVILRGGDLLAKDSQD